MRIPRLTHEPGAVVDFYREALESLGAVCDRTWYDRLQVLADGRAARLWNDEGGLCETELSFPAPDAVGPRDAHKEVFPGCPLTFRLAETMRPSPLPLETVVLGDGSSPRPSIELADKTWRAQFPHTSRWGLLTPLTAAHHFSLIGLVRCEIQAIDQHWSLHRLALSLPDGAADPELAAALALAEIDAGATASVAWPTPEPARWSAFLQAVLEPELGAELAAIRTRQQEYLRRELERIDDYFSRYERELGERAARSASENTKLKLAERLEATRSEHTRRRADQVARHEIRVVAHVDALLLAAERAWDADLEVLRGREAQVLRARLIPRTRRWVVLGAP